MSRLSLHKGQGDQGYAVTPFVTEYRHRSKQQKDPFTIEVEYLSDDEIRKELSELVLSYRQPFVPAMQDMSSKEFLKIEEESNVASYTLKRMFGERVETTEEFLKGGTTDSIINSLKNLARSFARPEGGVNGKWKSTAQTAQDCHQQIDIFMEEKFWPLMKIVRSVSSTSHIFSSITHIIFAESILMLRY